MVRAGDQRPLPADPVDPFVQLICDHPASLQRWRQVFGAEAFRPGRSRLAEGIER